MKTNNNYKFLAEKWTERHKELEKEIAKKHLKTFEWLTNNSKQLAVGSLSGLMLLTHPVQDPNDLIIKTASAQEMRIDSKTFLVTDLASALPQEIRALSDIEEANVSEILTKSYGINVSASVGDLRLNRSYGLIGAEQHLARYPGDSMSTHFEQAEDTTKYYSSGMAPGLGAWGYFTTSRAALTEEDTMREKYYIAVQSFLSPNFNEKVREYRDFYKYKKMLVVNPHNGKAVIADIADAGPAQWTGKHLGGSPEVMKHLERVDGSARGPVLYFFITDEDDTIPLGPIEPLK